MTHPTAIKYAVFSETNFEDMETWYTFISRKGNEYNLKDLKQQLEDVEWYDAPEMTAHFAIDIEGVSANTAKEMRFVDLGTRYFPNKFDGKMKKIQFNFSERDTDEDKALKVWDTIGNGHICDYLSDEDLDGCSLAGSDDEDYSTGSDSDVEEKQNTKPNRHKKIECEHLPKLLNRKIK
jgi:hypothetical protein